MADNTLQTGTANIATDDIGSVHYQIIKQAFGVLDSVTLVSSTNPLPVTVPPTTATGNITTQNLVPAGTATAGSAIEVTVDDASTLAVQVTGTYTGALSLQATVDGATWVTLGGQPLINISTGVAAATIASATVGIFQADVAAYVKVRITGLAAMTGTATVTLLAAISAGVVGLDTAIPAGTNLMGKVQELRDTGRNLTNYFMAAPIITTTGEVMMSLTGYKSGAAVGATATPAVVTAGKTYRIERVIITYVAATVIGSMRVNLRALSSGVAVIGSPLVISWQVGMETAMTAGAAQTYVFEYPEGLEFAAGFGIAISIQGFGAVPTTGTIVGYGMVALEGYEY